MEDIGQKIKSLRKSQGITQKMLSDKTGITRPMLVLIETGRHVPKYNTLFTILDAMGYRVNIVKKISKK